MKMFDLNPPPQVLVALTHTSMNPIDALCELVDNAIDSFSGNDENQSGINEIKIDLPTQSELKNGNGAIRVIDNGPGMTAEYAEKALTAGYSSQNAYDRLGMFGMGLNIATGKFASKTRLITATRNSDTAIVVDVDLNQLVEQKHYQVEPVEEKKEKYFEKDGGSGTIIELVDWWPSGSPNSDNPRKLIQHGPGRIRKTLGRRYATLLRSDSKPRFKLTIRNEKCEPFEHCVWADHRFVTKGSSQIHARQTINEVLGTQSRCTECGVHAGSDGCCPVDKSHPVRSVEERVRGWIGVQRYDDASHYGIDIIRNGRAIRRFEKEAFFTFTNDVGETIKDYPLDSPFGRIVGEIHLNHVRVDFTKQDFDRSTPEWQRAMEYLRGKSSLQPQQPGADNNDSPLIKIFKGYRRVRQAGLQVMYMGEWRAGDKKAQRVSREVEKDFLERFHRKEEGYHDDAKWWEKVEDASTKPSDYKECPDCEYQNHAAAEICEGCRKLLKSKKCIDCEKMIPQSAPKCDHCGKPQIPEGPWNCKVCESSNSPDLDECVRCGRPKGAVNIFDLDILLASSSKDDDLSVQGIEILLPDGEKSEKFDLETRIANLRGDKLHLPAVVHTDSSEKKLTVFLDKDHSVFLSMQLRPEHAVSMEAAAYIRAQSMAIMFGPFKHEHNLIALQEKLIDKYWRDNLSDDTDQVRREMHSLLEDVRLKIADVLQDISGDIFSDMPTPEISSMLNSMRESGLDISEMEKLKEKGTFLLYIPPETIISAFRNYPERFFDKKVWNVSWDIAGVPEENAKTLQKQLKETYLNCLEDGVGFLRYSNPPPVVVRRALLSIEFLQRDMAD